MGSAEANVRIVLATCGFLGTLLNIFVFYTLFQVKIGSLLTNTLLKFQCVFDAFACFVTFLYKLIGPEIVTGVEHVDRFFCYLWYSDNLIWLGISLSVCNIVCASLDRAVAVFLPLVYKKRQIFLVCFACAYQIPAATILFIPNLFSRDYISGRCKFGISVESVVIRQYIVAEKYTWLIVVYVIPLAVIISTHTAVIVYMSSHWNLGKLPAKQEMTSKEEEQWRMRRHMREIALTTVMMAGTLLVCHAYDAITYVLDSVGAYQYVILSLAQQTGLIPIVLSSCILPCITVTRIKTLRRYVIYDLIPILFAKFGLEDKPIEAPQ
ncbi:unnamed protein product [Echinostoma caproni]|uniref:G_PROTEIN_RECEP_F1_2 domain-containing protein n=1 Tax=Echinostoma caproni TaxID=27848 RepID=A0A183ATL9_9TREM|nr:unnamed protein product [Echinostoma caproni]